MRLIGMLDSPYVRRVAISLHHLGVPFEHEALSVFSTFDQFQRVNPVVKAPTLVCDDGEVLMDSSLILQLIEATMTHNESLWSREPAQLQHEMRAVSLALAACEKSAQIIYERNLRPKAAQHEPWLERVTDQLLAAYSGLEKFLTEQESTVATERSHASITVAVAWQFTQSMLANIVAAANYPRLCRLSMRMEQTAAFRKYPPDGPGVQASPSA